MFTKASLVLPLASALVIAACVPALPAFNDSGDGGGASHPDATTGPHQDAADAKALAREASAEASGGDGGLGDAETPVCTPSTERCADGGIETCTASAQWGKAWPCATGTCSGGACTGLTSGATNPSCNPDAGPPVMCGELASQGSCCTSLEVAGGSYHRTYDPSDDGGIDVAPDGGPRALADPATVSGFRLDEYEVTVGRFRPFVNAWNRADGGAGAYRPDAGAGKHAHLNDGKGLVVVGGDAGLVYEPGWVTADDSNVALTDANLTPTAPYAAYATWQPMTGNETLPMTSMNWYEAYAFCIWDGGFLPSEAEWEYAAAGGDAQREYPWGAAAPGTGNDFAIYGCNYPSTAGGVCTGVASFAPVGTTTDGVGKFGQFDLAGNAWEWNLDWMATYVNPCVDCTNLTPASEKLIRGGDLADPSDFMLARYRRQYAPLGRHYNIGFRCARTP